MKLRAAPPAGLLAALACVMVAAPLGAEPAGLALLEAGESAVLKLAIERPRETYWKFNPARSYAVERFELHELGVVGRQMRVRVTARAAGIAVVAYDLARKDELGTVVAQAEYGLKIDPDGPARVQADVGDRLELNLKGLPGAGHGWRLNEAASSGLDNVGIDERGWAPLRMPGLVEELAGGAALFGYELRMLKVGRSRLVFEYVRSGEAGSAPREKVIELDIVE